MRIIGVDPGKRGGIAYIDSENRLSCVAVRMPDSVPQIIDTLSSIKTDSTILLVEKAHTMPKQGIVSAFNYGKHFGIFETWCASNKVMYREISANVWKKVLHVDADKQTSIVLSERLFPDTNLVPTGCKKPSDGIAEAVLIAEFGYRVVANMESMKCVTS